MLPLLLAINSEACTLEAGRRWSVALIRQGGHAEYHRLPPYMVGGAWCLIRMHFGVVHKQCICVYIFRQRASITLGSFMCCGDARLRCMCVVRHNIGLCGHHSMIVASHVVFQDCIATGQPECICAYMIVKV